MVGIPNGSPSLESFFYSLFTNAGGLFGVEKVEPDPLNLAVNTGVGKRINELEY